VSNATVFNNVLYFVDELLSDLPDIVREIPAAANTTIINSNQDGVAQILSALDGKRELSAIHILSHGQPGAILLGATVIDEATLTARAEDFVTIGRALAIDGDLLIYGCNTAEGEVGKAFLAELANLTGANVAASKTLTGAAPLGGDWNLEVRLGSVQAAPLNIPSYAGVLAAPTIGGLSPITVTEGDAAQQLGGVTFTGGSGYAGGSITFGVSGSTSGDQVSLFNDSDPNAAGAISFDSTTGEVYYGNGTGRDLIGQVDGTANGQNGQPLTIHLIGTSTGAISNPSFEGSTSGWTINESRVILGTTVINGHVTPTDLTAPPRSTEGVSTGIDDGTVQSITYDSELATDQQTDGTDSLRLFLNGNTTDGYDVVHGPSVYSDTFAAQAGDIFTFDWRAAAGGDAFDAFGYLMNADTGEYVRVLDATGQDDEGETNWAEASVTVPTTGNWFFVFVAGTYDFTGGRAVGGSLYIDDFRVERSPVDDSVLSALAGNVQYQNTSDSPPDAPRNLTIEVTDGTGETTSTSTPIDISLVNDAPTGGVAVVGTQTQGQVLTASNDVMDPDGIVSSGYQWQRQNTDGSWSDITGATGVTYTLTQADVDAGHVRVEMRYTDAGGASEVVSGTALAVANANFASTGAVQISGTPTQGAVLTATNNVADPDGIDSSAYQWQRQNTDGSWSDITNATGVTYALAQDDVGLPVRAVLRFTDGDGVNGEVGSTPTVAVNNASFPSSGTVQVSGTPTQGEILTATNNVADPDGIVSSSYQWQHQLPDGTWIDIAGATDPAYTLTQNDVGLPVRAVLNYVDGDGTSNAIQGTPLLPVGNVNDAPSGGVDVAGDPAQGSVLTATNDVVDPDGIDTSTLVYQWQRQQPDGSWVDIGGATGANLTLTQDDVNAGHVRAVLSYTDLGGASELVLGSAITVGNVNDPASGGVHVAGNPTEDSVLTATNDVVDPDGIIPSSVAYQWQRQQPDGSWVNITGATGANLTLTQDDVNAGHVRAIMSYTDLGGAAEQVAGDAIPVTNINDAPTGAVTIVGEAKEGKALTALSPLADADGLGLFTYQWLADGEVIPGAGDPSFVLTSAQVGKAITVKVSYVDQFGAPESVSSVATARVVIYNDDHDHFTGGSGTDRLFGGTGNDLLDGGDGRDKLYGEGGNDTLSSGSGNDTLDGGSGNDRLLGGNGHDRLLGGSGTDRLDGGTGNDRLLGGTGQDRLLGGSGADQLDGGSGNDRLLGGTGHDRLSAGSGNDQLAGGSGNDWIAGGLGRDNLSGGSGPDMFVFNSALESRVGAQRDVISDFQSGQDLIDLRGMSANSLNGDIGAFTWACMDAPFLSPEETFDAYLDVGFSGKAGQVRFADGILMGDTNGDGIADFEIKIVGNFSSGDLLL
jgi:Ca2+-binding RTX toxin-like protein